VHLAMLWQQKFQVATTASLWLDPPLYTAVALQLQLSATLVAMQLSPALSTEPARVLRAGPARVLRAGTKKLMESTLAVHVSACPIHAAWTNPFPQVLTPNLCMVPPELPLDLPIAPPRRILVACRRHLALVRTLVVFLAQLAADDAHPVANPSASAFLAGMGVLAPLGP